MNDLEVWLIGSPPQLRLALTKLSEMGTIHYISEQTLAGKDRGRVRRYLRIVPAARRVEVKPKGRRAKPKDFEDEALPIVEEEDHEDLDP